MHHGHGGCELVALLVAVKALCHKASIKKSKDTSW